MRVRVASALVTLFVSRAAVAQPPSSKPSPQPAFEVASVRLAGPPQSRSDVDQRGSGGPGTSNPGRMTWRLVGVFQLLIRAYRVNLWQIQGLPDWTMSTAYDIVAKVPPGTTIEQSNLMLQNLLIERFGLVAHIETKPGEVYELTVAKESTKRWCSLRLPPT